METKKSMMLNTMGQPQMSSTDLVKVLLYGNSIDYVSCSDKDELDAYKKYQEDLLETATKFIEEPTVVESFTSYHSKNSDIWVFPQEFQEIDVYTYLINKCKTQTEIDRVEQEFKMFEDRDLIQLLRFFIFFVDYMRKNEHVWGVGRGSSVSSFILYLIGIHKVDSLKYNLDISEYLKK